MRLNKTALGLINTPATRMKLAIALVCSEFTILRYINQNSDNLTKLAAMKVIKKETGLSEKELFAEETKVA